MSMTLEAPKTFAFATKLSEEDIRTGVSVLMEADCVANWANKRGRPERDIEMEVGNVMTSRQFHVPYQQMRDKLMAVYGMTERELVTALMKEMTPAAIAVRREAREAEMASKR